MNITIFVASIVFSSITFAQSVQQEQLYTIEQVEKIKLNSVQPVIYGKGAAGITIETPEEDAAKILAPPAYISETGNLYAEGIFVAWNTESKKPNYILVMSNYFGEIQTANSDESFNMNKNFSDKYLANNLNSAEQMTRDLYVMFEKQPKNFDCLAENLCRVIWGDSVQKSFVVELPGMILLFSKDRLTLFRLLIK